ncbi:PAAR domain-containing protein [Pseudomonas sp. S75]|uniref:PAAR domain-containing protein n=1 Tax=unclassified Pseudomonas TaxID=196821 RepID=UPI001906CA57|nr:MULTISPECIES: PAAR domain-containing protein [unclassified Pseudomonas]MBJ9978439.1 PAAR domain-containing protein [Pseudomonas sp. S30]MBK0152263.1 PAAR domain-containing protein [Pseudomonas sp. S75]
MKPIVLTGHKHQCPLHGEGKVISGTPSLTVKGRAAALAGDRISCGAIIEPGAARFHIEGKAVARQGDRTDHGGVLTEGDPDWEIA